MPIKKKVDDEVRLNVLRALFEQGCLVPNIRQIQKKTGYNKNTIKASLDFLSGEGVLRGYYPSLQEKKLGFGLMPVSLLHFDHTKKEIGERVFKAIKEDPHVFLAGEIIGVGNWDMVVMSIHRDVEGFHRHIKEYYRAHVPDRDAFIKNRERFYITSTELKNERRSIALLNILKEGKRV